MKKSFFSAFVILFFCSFFCFGKGISFVEKDPSGNTFFCNYKNEKRKFSLWMPENTEIPSGLILMLHGYGESITSFKNKTKMNEAALPEGFAVCYVSSGSEPGWNFGGVKGKKDDYGFISSLIKYLSGNLNLKKEQVYLCGFSNGAFMCHYAALQKNPPFAGIIAVSGLAVLEVWNKNFKNCRTDLFQIYGTKDDLVLSKENAKENISRGYPYIEEVRDAWISENSLVLSESETLNEISHLEKYTGEKNKMWIMKIDNYPHQWPDSRTTGYELSKLIMDFLKSGK